MTLVDLRKRRAIGPIGNDVILVDPKRLNSHRYSVTAMVQLSSDAPVVVSHPRKGSNNQVDFIRFLLCLIEDGHLQNGDILIVDNASVHAGRATNSMLLDLLTANNVKLIFLPTYSPELNPIKLVFGWVKFRFVSLIQVF